MKNSLATAAFGLAILIASGADAQQSWRNKFQPMNFDMWCQEHKHLPPERCDKRLPQDDAEFQAYANKIENYETQQLNQNAQDRRINRAIQNSDPSSNPAGTPPTQPIPPPR
ncbi:MAG TPA: hypothetical protein VMD53_03855 [Rhizomicrobium sp.]|nr:hypothetical protein [Rhizomicrobium sp.]